MDSGIRDFDSGFCADVTLREVVRETFGTWDYVTFAAMLALASFIGIYFAVVDRNKVRKAREEGGN